MNTLNDTQIDITPELRASRSVLIILGVLQILFGMIALSVPWIVSDAVAKVVAILFIIAGFVQFFQALHSHFGSKIKCAVGILVSILYVAAGVFLLLHPAKAIIALTLIVGWFFTAKGIILMIEALRTKSTKGWMMFNAAVTLILGLMILIDIQGGSIWIIGVLVGINFIITGWTALLLGMSISKN